MNDKSKKFSKIMGPFLMIVGLILLFIKGQTVSYVDKNGLLHEAFFLIPIGYLFILIGLIVIAVNIIKKIKNR